MAAMTKREGALRILDARASARKLKTRIVVGSVVIAIAGLGVGSLTQWEFGLATVLLLGLLFQYAVERMGTIIEASIANGLKAMGWDLETELTEEKLEKIKELAER